ncbi:hypothetical protein C2845_PM06G28420 [Panicum miliaceum]|uniref:F-box domain-containing protein n=1 Tax=Panicum miliaceum TaxID=4540 RepID=A0A3L6R7T9_PANMI|nr:hypothetical protein C2845_PM06G28420 [Panicum miliaceum]
MSSSAAPPLLASGWAGLPHDVLWSVFTVWGQREILSGAGLACVAWWRFARDEPALWRRINLTAAPPDEDDTEKTPAKVCDESSGWKAMALAAVHRCAGQCEAFWGRADDDVLLYLADRASSMKSLRVTSHYDVSSEVFAEVIKKFPLLEELELVLKPEAWNYTTKSGQPPTNSWVELFQSACEACSHLHSFTVRSDTYYLRERSSPTPFSIPVMHGLQSLELSDGSFTKDVVMQIVDKCPGLESLDISDVPVYRWDEELRNKCSRIEDLKLQVSCYYDTDSDYYDIS